MSELFCQYYEFNDNINNWDVSNVTIMEKMFESCIKFNQSLNNWNVSNVKYFNNVFRYCNNLLKKPKWYPSKKLKFIY